MVGVVSVGKKFFVDREGEISIEPVCSATCLEYIDVDPPQENFGWRQALYHLAKERKVKSYSRAAVIVDSDLQNLASYNNREKPFWKGVYLPHNITLIYASGDTGSSLANKLLKEADRVSRGCLLRLKTGFTSPRQSRIWDINYA